MNRLNEIGMLKRGEIDIDFARTRTIIRGESHCDVRFQADRVAEHQSESVSTAAYARARRDPTRRATAAVSGRSDQNGCEFPEVHIAPQVIELQPLTLRSAAGCEQRERPVCCSVMLGRVFLGAIACSAAAETILGNRKAASPALPGQGLSTE